ncbi:unnamed protein product [Peniophora sp. CBMAI 1063]|nr:unnamed protein product [Peniophora sp. CBMAI 1063]
MSSVARGKRKAPDDCQECWKLRRDKAQLEHRNNILAKQKDSIISQNEKESLDIMWKEREVSRLQLEVAQRGAAQTISEKQERIDHLTAVSEAEREELERLRVTVTSLESQKEALQKQVKVSKTRISNFEAECQTHVVSAEAILSRRVDRSRALKLPAEVMRPSIKYLRLNNLNEDSSDAYQACWELGYFEVDSDEKIPDHGPLSVLTLGRSDHSPGFPSLPGQPGTIITHDIFARGRTEKGPFTLGIISPDLSLKERDRDVRWRYLGVYMADSAWEPLTRQEWMSFSLSVRQNWCTYLANPSKNIGCDWCDWVTAARISLRKAKLPYDDPKVAEAQAIAMREWHVNGTSPPVSLGPRKITRQEVDDALCIKGEEVLYIRKLVPVRFDLALHRKLQSLEQEATDTESDSDSE